MATTTHKLTHTDGRSIEFVRDSSPTIQVHHRHHGAVQSVGNLAPATARAVYRRALRTGFMAADPTE